MLELEEYFVSLKLHKINKMVINYMWLNTTYKNMKKSTINMRNIVLIKLFEIRK